MISCVKSTIKRLCGGLFYVSGFFYIVRLVNNLIGNRLTIVTYHRVTDLQIANIRFSLPYLFVTKDTFEKQLLLLKKYYRVITFDELSRFPKGNIPWNSLIITFDDGYEDNYSLAYPILKKHNMKAALFLTANKIEDNNTDGFWWDKAYYYFKRIESVNTAGTEPESGPELLSLHRMFKKNTPQFFAELNTWDNDKIDNVLQALQDLVEPETEAVKEANRILTWNQIGKMRQHIEIGSHSCNHRNLLELEHSQQVNEIRESKKTIEEKIKQNVRVFSYPAGNNNEYTKKIVKEEGYDFGVTTESGLNDLGDAYGLKRINVWEGTSESFPGKFSRGMFFFHLSGIRR